MRRALRLLAANAPPPQSKRAAFRALQPSPRWLKRIADVDVGRVRRPRQPKESDAHGHVDDAPRAQPRRGRNAGGGDGWADAAPTAASGLRTEHPAGPLFRKLKLICRAVEPSEMPPEDMPEVAFCGRSNVGKSTLINRLTWSSPSRVSPRPGETQALTFFALGVPRRAVLVDMPGYGFAFAPEDTVQRWTELMHAYVTGRRTLRRVYLLLDGRHGIKHADVGFMERLDAAGTRFTCVLTKCDQVPVNDLARRAALVEEALQRYPSATTDLLLVSKHSAPSLLALKRHIRGVVAAGGRESEGVESAGAGDGTDKRSGAATRTGGSPPTMRARRSAPAAPKRGGKHRQR